MDKFKDKAFETAKKMYTLVNEDCYRDANSMLLKKILEKRFPELVESEDERMCKTAIEACKYMIDNFENSTQRFEEAIAWLEKQCKQKSDSKTEPKFKIKAECSLQEFLEKFENYIEENNPYKN